MNSDRDGPRPVTGKFIVPDIPSRAVMVKVLERALPLSAVTHVTAPPLSEDQPELINPGSEVRVDVTDDHGLHDAVSVTVPVVPTKRVKGEGVVAAVTVHLEPTVIVRVGLVTMSVVAKPTATAPPPAAPAVTVIVGHAVPALAHERPVAGKVRSEREAVRVAVPPAALGRPGVMQQVMPLVYSTPVTSVVLGIVHVTVFAVSITTVTGIGSAYWKTTEPDRTA